MMEGETTIMLSLLAENATVNNNLTIIEMLITFCINIF
jgi:hypothetical protein